MRRLTFALLAGALAAAAPAAAADAADERVAAPGACAEPRRFDAAGCTDCPSSASTSESDFSVAGPARSRFSPADVAASSPGAGAMAPPELGGFEGRGPCDTPGSCTGSVAPTLPGQGSPGGGRPGVTVVERPPRPGGPPGTD
jgi:hypothetical protein